MTFVHLFRMSIIFLPLGMFADPHHCNADPDPSFHFNPVPDPIFHFNAVPDPTFYINAETDPDPAPHQCVAHPRPLVHRPYRLHFEPSRLHCQRPRPSKAPF